MVSVRKRKMNRSAVKKQTKKDKNPKEKFNPKSNPVIAKYWNPNLTAKQNYTKLGLKMSLGKATGGVEKELKIPKINRDNELEDLEQEEEEEAEGEEEESNTNGDPFDPKNILEGTAKIEKDAEGKVVRIVYGTKKISEQESQDEDEEKLSKIVINELEEMANKPKKDILYKLNSVEVSRYSKLENKYGDNFTKMQWDQKLNPYQLSAGELKRKFAILHKQQQQSSL